MPRTRVDAIVAARPARSLWTRLALALAAAAAFCAVVAGGASAHHGWSGYDENSFIVMTGVIQELEYANPHVTIKLEVPPEPEDDGSIVDPPLLLTVVLAPPFRAENRGLKADMLQAGTTATVEGYPARLDVPELRAERITVHGMTVEMR
jgi:hypothetical protein